MANRDWRVVDGAVLNNDENEWQRFQSERQKALELEELKRKIADIEVRLARLEKE